MPALGHCQTGAHRASLWHASTRHQRARAIQICESCPLFDACRRYALEGLVLERGVPVVVGGLTDRQIRAARKRLGIPEPTYRFEMPVRQRVLAAPRSDEDRAAKYVRAGLGGAHAKGMHERTTVPNCPRCERETEPCG